MIVENLEKFQTQVPFVHVNVTHSSYTANNFTFFKNKISNVSVHAGVKRKIVIVKECKMHVQTHGNQAPDSYIKIFTVQAAAVYAV